MDISVADIVWLCVWGGLYVTFWLIQISYYRCKHFAKGKPKPPTYWQKFKYDHLVVGILYVHEDDPFTRPYRIFILIFNMLVVLALSSLQFHKSGCIESQELNWSINFLVRVIQSAFLSIFLVWLFRFDYVMKRLKQRRLHPCCVYDLIVFCILVVVIPILLAFCSDFYHQCELRFVLLKWGVSLLVEYMISQPLQILVELKLLRKYDIFIPKEETPLTGTTLYQASAPSSQHSELDSRQVEKAKTVTTDYAYNKSTRTNSREGGGRRNISNNDEEDSFV
jgi:hypothetical protein